jgi:hypothetical protein
MCRGSQRKTFADCCSLLRLNEGTDSVEDVARALVRAVFALLRTQASGIDHGVHTSVNAARMSARATSSSALVGQQGHGNSLSSAQTQKP